MATKVSEVSLPFCIGQVQDDINTELWHKCAGPHVYVPKAGEKVFYFPQGHIEQTEAYTSQDGCSEMPIYNLPSKILCKVISVQLRAEAGTDEVFAQIILFPETELDGQNSKDDELSISLPQKTSVRSFTKKLTLSDTSTHGGFSVLRRHAEECFPPLLMQDMSEQPPMQTLLAKDVHGSEWCFRHVYRGTPKRHLLTTGWSTFVNKKKLAAGDAFIFLRGENGELRVGVRRAANPQNTVSTSVISANSMKHGILATALHAISTGTLFTVYYHPWTSPTEFIISYDQYTKSAEIDFSTGARIRRLFEGEDNAEQRIGKREGTVVGIDDLDPIRWPNSEWRSLKVKWDSASYALMRTERISPWSIEPIEPIKKKATSVLHRPKRARALDTSVPKFPSLVKDDFLHGRIECALQSHPEVLQGQENRDKGVDESDVHKPPVTIPNPSPVSSPPCTERNRVLRGLEDQLHFSMHGLFYLSPSSTVSVPGGNIVNLGVPNGWSLASSSHGICGNPIGSRNLPVPNVNPHNSRFLDQRALKLKDTNDVPLAPQNGGGMYKLFGVNLIKNPPELPSPQIASPSELGSLDSVPHPSESSISESSKCTSGINSAMKRMRSCTKVLKYGTAHGRSIDLTRFDGYDALICELDHMFDFEGSLIDGSSGWHISYIDDEGDMMLIGDYPWHEFQYIVRRMFLCPKEDINKLIKSSPNPNALMSLA